MTFGDDQIDAAMEEIRDVEMNVQRLQYQLESCEDDISSVRSRIAEIDMDFDVKKQVPLLIILSWLFFLPDWTSCREHFFWRKIFNRSSWLGQILVWRMISAYQFEFGSTDIEYGCTRMII